MIKFIIQQTDIGTPIIPAIWGRGFWPGNIRELDNVVERAVTLSKGKKITMSELPTHLFPEKAEAILFDQIKFTDAK